MGDPVEVKIKASNGFRVNDNKQAPIFYISSCQSLQGVQLQFINDNENNPIPILISLSFLIILKANGSWRRERLAVEWIYVVCSSGEPLAQTHLFDAVVGKLLWINLAGVANLKKGPTGLDKLSEQIALFDSELQTAAEANQLDFRSIVREFDKFLRSVRSSGISFCKKWNKIELNSEIKGI